MNIVLRILWKGGVTRVAMEEARLIPAKLLVYRRGESVYDLTGTDLSILFDRNNSRLIYSLTTSIYAGHRGKEATVDLDRIFAAKDLIKGPSLFHDQFAGLTGYLRKRDYGEDYAVYIHETMLDSKGAKWFLPKQLEKKVLDKSKLIITNSNWNKEILGGCGYRAEVVYPGCHPQENINMERERIVLAVSLWDKGRKPEVYGEIARKIRGKLVLAGSWAKPEDMLEFKRKYSGVVVTGTISEGELQALYGKASLLIRFGFHEKGPGLGVLEAMGYGLPVIVNQELGSKELIKDNGFVVKDWAEAIDRINEILDDESLRKRMGSTSWEIAKTLTWRNHAEKVKELMVKYLQ
ncbi:MAG: glycosyltransferase family 4 protein [Thermoprotei archaeon]